MVGTSLGMRMPHIKSEYFPVVKAESPTCTINSTLGQVVASTKVNILAKVALSQIKGLPVG